MHRLIIESKRDVTTFLSNVNLQFNGSCIKLFSEELVTKIILKSTTQHDIENVVAEEFIRKVANRTNIHVSIQELSKNPLMTLDVIMKYKHLPWDWNYIIWFRDLKLDFIENNVELFNDETYRLGMSTSGQIVDNI